MSIDAIMMMAICLVGYVGAFTFCALRASAKKD